MAKCNYALFCTVMTLFILSAATFSPQHPSVSGCRLERRRPLARLICASSSPIDDGMHSSIERPFDPISAKSINDNELEIITAEDGTSSAHPRQQLSTQEQSAKPVPDTDFNAVLTHYTVDFDSLASAVGLARL